MSKAYEYKVVSYNSGGRAWLTEANAELEALGKLGWHVAFCVASTSVNMSRVTWTLEREIPQEDDPAANWSPTHPTMAT